jgi:hypothetical protein
MKKQYKAILLAVLGFGGISAAQAQDALLGFNDATGTQNDYVIDLGAASQFSPTATIDLSSDFSSSLFSSAFGSTPAGVAAGFVAGPAGAILESYAGGTPSGSLPSGTPTPTQFNTSQTSMSGILLGVNPSASGVTALGSAWSWNIAVSPSQTGGAGSTAVAGNTGNPMGMLSSDAIDLAVYESTATSGRTEKTTAWTQIGTLAVDANAGSIVFTGSAVPEPTTYGLVGAAGLMLISLRNKFSRKQA